MEGEEPAQNKRQRLGPDSAAPSSLPSLPPDEPDVLLSPPPAFFLMANRGLPHLLQQVQCCGLLHAK